MKPVKNILLWRAGKMLGFRSISLDMTRRLQAVGFVVVIAR